ncbi:MAG TPA: hybrid sensor histidine kinase/response regulator [Azospirillum sp.]|nr:hybrid sensor histidine kinase/response regulator [Azospirillum sp.]
MTPILHDALAAARRRLAGGQLARRFALASATLSVVLAVLVGAALHTISRARLIDQHQGNVQASAALVARQTEGLLAAVVETMGELSENSVLATALVDSAGKETYLLPFLRSFDHVAGVPVSLVFTDFEGVPIANNGRPAMTGRDMAWLAQAMAAGRSTAVVVEDEGRPYLLAAEMLVYSRTASPEGALLYKLPFDALVLHPEARLRHAGSASTPPPGEGRIAVDVPLRTPERLAPLGLALHLEAPAVPAASLLAIGLPAYALVGVAALAAILLGSRVAGYHLTRSLRDLERLAGTIVREGFTGQRAQVRGEDEVGSLARAFNAMLDRIAAMQEDRERQAEEEITIQRTLTRHAEQARAEAEAAKNEAERARQEAVMALITAERANEAKTRFLAAASHDLRQPVQSLVLLTASLAARLGEHPAASLLGSLQASVDALCRLLEGLLDVSKLDAGTVPANLRPVPVSAILQGLEAEYRLRAEEKGLTFRTVPSSLTLRTDPALLERVLRNLLENALRYTDRGGILLGCRRQGECVLIQVHDTGVGIPAEHLERIFLEFYQVSNPARDRGKGLGLGLAIVDRLARLLGCRVRVVSRPERGSCFMVEVPLAAGAAPELSAPPAVAAASAAAIGPGIALVIDDDPLVRQGLALLIEQSGWRVVVAESGPDAVNRLASGPGVPTLVIADYRLEGGTTGLDALRAVEAWVNRPLLCVVLTGDTAPERIADVQASGYRILHKPLAVRDLLALLAEASAGVAPVVDRAARTA